MAGMPIRRARRARRNPGIVVMSPRHAASSAKAQTALKLLESAIHFARLGKYAEASERLTKGAEKVSEMMSAMYPAAAPWLTAFLRSADNYVNGRAAPYAIPLAVYGKLPAAVRKYDEHPHEKWMPQGVVNQLYEAMRDRDFDIQLSAPSLPVPLEDMERMYLVLENAVGYPFREERKAHHIRKRR